MTLDEFSEIYQRRKEKYPSHFELADKPATSEQVAAVERELGVKLPDLYRSFLMEFGGGTFGFVEIFSADPESGAYILDKMPLARQCLPTDYLAFSEDGSGGYFAFRILDGKANEAIFYWAHDTSIVAQTEFKNILSYIAETRTSLCLGRGPDTRGE